MVQALNTQMASPATKRIVTKKPITIPKRVAKVKVVTKKTPQKKVTKVNITIKKPVKPAPKPVKKVPVAPKPVRSGSAKGGWFGESGGAGNLAQWYGATRKLWLPPGLLDRSEVSPYLNGSLPGDYGYDPLGLGKSIAEVERLREFELIHCRWAMLGAAGMIIPEGLAANGADIKGAAWYETGAAMLDNQLLNYFAVPFGVVNNPLPLLIVVGIEVCLMYLVETYRQKGSGPAGYAPGIGFYTASEFTGLDKLYPGGPLDPLGLAQDPEVFQELKVKEIKNGRLAMMATLGFAFQAVVTGEGPYANWSKHIADPFGYNLLTVLGSEDRVPTL